MRYKSLFPFAPDAFLVILIISLLFFAGCKKDWTCTCEQNANTTQMTNIFNEKKGEAEKICNSNESAGIACTLQER